MRPALVPILLADPLLWAAKAPYAWDFLKDRARFAGGYKGALANTPGWTATPATHSAGGVLYASTASGALQSFASGTLRRTDNGVLIEGARTNLYLQSNNFSASWNLTNVTVTAAATTAPDGTLTAQKVEATTSASTIINQNAANGATSSTFSIYCKKGSGATDARSFVLRNHTTSTNLLSVEVDYDTGAITYNVGSSGVSMTALADGWWRLVMTATSGITSGDGIRCYPAFSGGSETAGEYCYLWGAQLEAASFPSSYIPTTTASATRAADVLTVPVSGLTYPLSLFAEAEYSSPSAATGTDYIFSTEASSIGVDSASLYFSGLQKPSWLVFSGSANQGNSAAAASASFGAPAKMAVRVATNDARFCSGGTLLAADTSLNLPASPTLIRWGSTGGSNMYLRRAAIWPRALSDSELTTVST